MLQDVGYVVRMFVGSRFGYTEKSFSREELIGRIRTYFDLNPGFGLCVRVSTLTFVAPGYIEDGFELTASNYPRFPLSPVDIDLRMDKLATHLLKDLQQKRISLETPFLTKILENPEIADR